MEAILKHIENLYNTIHTHAWDRIQKIPQSGGDRIYFRISQAEKSWIATYNLKVIRPFERSYGLISTLTVSPTIIFILN